MADNDQKYQLFIPGKTNKDAAQPGYGNDMRTIEQWATFIISQIQAGTDTLVAEITALQTAVGVLQVQVGSGINLEVLSYTVGSAPPAGTRLIVQKFTITPTFTAGVGSVALSGFSHGYDAIVGQEGIPVGVIAGWDSGTSSLTSLSVTATETPATPLTGTQSISVVVIGA